ncbi:hypothetical protein J6590_062992 [Homalodisca vitripennis]|nr:hypothetical protein J6590_062992 [Homalodisca vitripennis]
MSTKSWCNILNEIPTLPSQQHGHYLTAALEGTAAAAEPVSAESVSVLESELRESVPGRWSRSHQPLAQLSVSPWLFITYLYLASSALGLGFVPTSWSK